jgi:hypothetical protein
MSDLTTVQRVAYANDVKHAFQAKSSNLQDTIRIRNAPEAGTYEFRTFAELEMVARGAFKSLLNALDANHGKVPCTTSPFVLPVLTDTFEQAGSGGQAPQEQNESAIAAGYAMKRKCDSSVITALEAGTPESIITAGSGLVVDKLVEGIEHFDKYEMRGDGDKLGDGTLFLAITEKQHKNLLADAKTQSIDTSEFKSLTDGKVKEFCGYSTRLIGTGRGANGLLATGATRRCYAWVKTAMGQVRTVEPKIQMGYELLYTSDVMVAMLAIGSVMIDARGVQQFDCTES